MTDEKEYTPPPSYAPLERLKRMCMLFAVLFGIWAFVAFVVPHLMGVATKNSVTLPVTPPVAVVETPPVEPVIEITPMPENNVMIANLRQQIEALELRVKVLEGMAVNAFKSPQEGSVVESAHMVELEQQIKNQQAAIDEMKQATEKNNRELASVTLFTQMKEALLAGDNYRDQWARLSTLLQDHEDIKPLLAKLEPTADAGLITLIKLENNFEAAIPRVLSPARDKVSDVLHSLVRVRKIGEEQKGIDDESVIARAEAKLHQGNVAQALKELTQLSPPAAETMAGWKREAQHYIDAHATLDAISAALFSKAEAP